jgi:excisionase family DNA binding protein
MAAADFSRGHVQSLVRGLLDALDDAALDDLAIRLRERLADDAGRLLDVRAAAARLRLHPETLSRMARTGRIAAVKIGRGWRFHANCLDIRPQDGQRAADRPAERLVVPRPRHDVERASVAAIRGRV